MEKVYEATTHRRWNQGGQYTSETLRIIDNGEMQIKL